MELLGPLAGGQAAVIDSHTRGSSAGDRAVLRRALVWAVAFGDPGYDRRRLSGRTYPLLSRPDTELAAPGSGGRCAVRQVARGGMHPMGRGTRRLQVSGRSLLATVRAAGFRVSDLIGRQVVARDAIGILFGAGGAQAGRIRSAVCHGDRPKLAHRVGAAADAFGTLKLRVAGDGRSSDEKRNAENVSLGFIFLSCHVAARARFGSLAGPEKMASADTTAARSDEMGVENR